MPNQLRCVSISMLLLAGATFVDAQTEEKKKDDSGEEHIVVLEKFIADEKAYDPNGLIPKSPSGDVFGMAKPVVETPRSITIVASEMIDKFNINELVDLARFAPSTYTAFSFGIQGAVDVRGDGADVYYRGVKRINNGSNMPTLIGASDGVSVVRGPPSAVNGSGRVGGYMNYLPKSARASTGRYLDHETGKVALTFGAYGKKQLSVEEGGPAKVFGKRAGYYVYGQLEDSDSFYIGSYTRQQVLQGTLTVDLTDALRLETGINYQNFDGTGLAGWNRITQDLINNRNYITGVPLKDLDTNKDGLLSRNEILAAGDLNKNLAFPFTTPRPALPAGFALDPATVKTVKLSPRQVLVERDGFGRDYIFFADLVNDKDSSLVFRNKVFTEFQQHHKLSDIAYFRAHEAFVAEEKFTVEWTPRAVPHWLKFAALGAVNVRYLDTYNITTSGEQIFSRWDLTQLRDGHYGITNGWDTPDAAGIESATKSQHTETGGGMILDSTFFNRTNVMVGVRFDTVYARVGTPPTNIKPAADWAEGSDKAASLSSFSVSHEIFSGIRLYATYAKPRTIVPGSSGGLTVARVRSQILEPSELKEAGLKMSFFKDRLYVATSTFEQQRSTYNATLDEYQNTKSDGTDLEIRWVPTRNFNISASADWKRSLIDPITAAASTQVTPAFAGYDPIAAYGGRLTITLPADPKYARRYSPDKVFSVFANYAFAKKWDVSLGSNYQAGFPLSSTQDIILPSALTFSGSVGYTAKTWEVRASGRNLTDRLYFQPSGFGSTIAIPAVGRVWDVKYIRKF